MSVSEIPEPLEGEALAEALQRVDLARALATEALERIRRHVTPHGYDVLLEGLVFELLSTAEGGAMLDRLLPRAPVDRSGEVEKGGPQEQPRLGKVDGGTG